MPADKNDLELFDYWDGGSSWNFGVRWKKGTKYKRKTKDCGHLIVTVHDGYGGIKYSVQESEIDDDDVRGLGIGFGLYERAIQKFGSLSTTYRDASPWARRTWLKLVQKYSYETDFWSGYLTVYAKKKEKS